MSTLHQYCATVNSNIEDLAPFVKLRAVKAFDVCHASNCDIYMFEGLRSADRQDYLYASSRSRPGVWLTDAQGWQSFHQYGVAMDLAFGGPGKWTWQGNWERVLEIFHGYGFTSLPARKEIAHVQMNCGLSWREAKSLYDKSQKLNDVWTTIEKRLPS